jgi:hypothetical protein
MTINTPQIMDSNIILAAVILSPVILILMALITRYLDNKPKSNKLRKWWSNHICDLDNLYDN